VLGRFADRQYGHVTRAQALAAGMRPGAFNASSPSKRAVKNLPKYVIDLESRSFVLATSRNLPIARCGP
jgi:hypothetical protein